MSIGQVIAQLRPDFPDVSISKLRFLEAEGLIEPERASSGYRRFTDDDVDRLRYILAAQRDQYLPLKVIREHLEAIERGLNPPAAAGGAPRVPVDYAEALGEPVDVRAGAPVRTPAVLRISVDELVANSGLSRAHVEELIGFGLLGTRPGTDYFDADALVVASAVARLAEYGLEPRHVRAFKSAADRQVGLIEQVVSPLARQKDEAAKARAAEMTVDLVSVSVRLHAALVRSGLRDAG